MEIEFKQTTADYFNTSKYIGRYLSASTKFRYVMIVSVGFSLMLISFGTLLLLQHYDTSTFVSKKLDNGLMMLVIGVTSLIIGFKLYSFRLSKLIFSENGIFLSTQKFKIEDNYLLLYMGANEFKYNWKTFKNIEKTDDYIYLFIDRGVALYIPRHGFQTIENYDDFYNAIKHQVHENR